jgi:hypothetical protein
MFSVVVAAILGLLGRHSTQHSLDADALSNSLDTQRDALLHALATLPADLGQGLARLVTEASTAIIPPVPAVPLPSRNSPMGSEFNEGHSPIGKSPGSRCLIIQRGYLSVARSLLIRRYSAHDWRRSF